LALSPSSRSLYVKRHRDMSAAPNTVAIDQEFPRFFRIIGYSVNSYKFFLCVGIYVGTLATAALASFSGLSPLRVGLAAMSCALAGLIGARVYFLLVNASFYLKHRSLTAVWDSSAGGLSLFGSLLTFIPTSFAAAAWLQIPLLVLWDYMALGVLAGGFWIRLGCVLNGCCAGRETRGWLSVHLHDTRRVTKPRIPVQFMEMAWWLIGLAAFIMLWPGALPPGSYALAVTSWYGAGRFFLEPLRERPNIVFGRVRIDQVVAALLAIAAGGALIIRGCGG
jgi:phosphatidylglycerol---prolipoprotein diacylglyceryl transferase